MPLVSVIIPTYNRATLLKDALASVLNQTFTDYEVIVVDDGSTDNTEDIVQSFPDISYFKQQNLGPAVARNIGLKKARGSYIAYLDSDDVWDNAYLENSLTFLEQNLDVGFIFSNLRIVNLSGEIICNDKHQRVDDRYNKLLASYRTKKKEGFYILEHSEARSIFFKNYVSFIQASIFRKDIITHEWWGRISTAEDYLFTLESLMKEQFRVAFTDDILVTLRVHDSNIYQQNVDSKRHINDTILMLQYVMEKYKISHDEEKTIRKRLAKLYRSLGYLYCQNGQTAEARKKYVNSLLLDHNTCTLIDLIKTIIPSSLKSKSSQ